MACKGGHSSTKHWKKSSPQQQGVPFPPGEAGGMEPGVRESEMSTTAQKWSPLRFSH